MSLTATEPIRKCGKRYASKDEALNSKRGRSGNYLAAGCPAGCQGWHLKRKPVLAGVTRKPASTPKASASPRKAPEDTGFPPGVKLLIRTRAGNGDPEHAHCEACGIWLGLHGGQIQHIYARGEGGTSDPLYNSAANGAALCGTSETGDHGLCEDRDPHMNEAGFWRKRNGKEKPGDYPIMLHGQGGGRLAWLTPEGTYADGPPGEAAA